MRNFKLFTHFWVLILLTIVKSALSQNFAACHGEFASNISSKIKTLETKIDEIQDTLFERSLQPSSAEFWEGNQSTFVSFRRLSNDAKSKLLVFKLNDVENLDVSTLIQELRPCTSLGSLKLHRVELNGAFPSSSSSKLTLPKLYEFDLFLTNYPNVGVNDILARSILFEKDAKYDVQKISNWKTNINVQIKGYTKFVINHDFSELVLDVESFNDDILKSLDPEVFKLKRLTVQTSGWNVSEYKLPTDLSYLNLKYVGPSQRHKPTSDYNYVKIVNELRRLKSLHIDSDYDPEFGAKMDLSQVPYYIQNISLRQMSVNATNSLLLSEVQSILFDGCHIDHRIIDQFDRSFRNVRKVAMLFNSDSQSMVQCHPLRYKLIVSQLQMLSIYRVHLNKLEFVFITRCEREFHPSQKPKHYDEVEQFLTNLGLGKSQDFELQVSKASTGDGELIWTGRNVTRTSDEKLVKHQFSDWYKLRTWETYNS